MVIILAFACWIYFQTTPGKYILGLKIVDQETLQKPTTKQLIIRAISVLLSVITLGIGYLALIFDKRKRTWHDRIAGTMVINPKKYLSDAKASSK